jgi:ABC-2 type transport system ATP-binding protein
MIQPSEPYVQTFKVTKVFRDFWRREKVAAVRELDLEVRPNEVLGLLGPNGSGKSTTIKMILGLLYPTRGFIRVFGKRPTDVSIKARIGFLPEESYLYPFLNAWETLDYYGRLFKQPRIQRRQRVEMLLDMVGLTQVAYRRVGEYSKGMQRRIGLAQALINDPDLLILDEPTSGLDPLGTRQVKDLIQQLGRRGKTIVLSSHLLSDVEDVCQRVAILYGGRLRACGEVNDLLSQHGLTQIIAEDLSPAALDKIRAIAAGEGKSVLDISAPRQKLESLFLQIVADAQRERIATGGAVDTGRLAPFLRGEGELEGPQVVEQLLAATNGDGAAAAAQPVAPVRPPVPLDAELLSELTDAAEHGDGRKVLEDRKAAPTKPAKPAPAPPPAADRRIIDSLMKDDQADHA